MNQKNREKITFIDLEKTLTSGQFFHYREIENGYGMVNGNQVYLAENHSGEIHLLYGEEESFYHFLDGKTCYGDFLSCQKEERLREIIQAGAGLRILNQDPWDVILSFILSTNNNMIRIKNSVHALGENYGRELLSYEGKVYYALPSPEVLAMIPAEELRHRCGVGYRDRYLVASAEMIAEGDISLNAIYAMDYDRAQAELMKLPGVGVKAADCILLFGYHRMDSFPVDTWIDRMMSSLYGEFSNRAAIAEFGRREYGEMAGFMQQLLFYYGTQKKKKR